MKKSTIIILSILVILSQIILFIFSRFESKEVKEAKHLIENTNKLTQKYCYYYEAGYYNEVPYIKDTLYCKQLLQIYGKDEYTSHHPKFVKEWLHVSYFPFYVLDYKCDSQLVHFIMVGPPPCNKYIMGYVDKRSVNDTISKEFLIFLKNHDPNIKTTGGRPEFNGLECNSG